MNYSTNDKLPLKIGIYHDSGIGDWFLLSSAIKELKKRAPDTKIFVVTNRQLGYFLRADRSINGYSLLPDYAVFKKNFKPKEEIFISSFWGFFKITGCRQHVINLTCKLFNIDKGNLKPEIYLNPEDESYGRSFAKSLKNKMVTLCCHTSDRRKDWDSRRWGNLVKKFKDLIFVQIGAFNELIDRPIKGVVNMSGKVSLPQAVSLVKYSKLFLGCEGIFNHAANVFGIPKVILWGVNNPRNFAYSENTINIWNKVYCSPCKGVIRKKCINRKEGSITRCMSAIREYEVSNAVKKMLKEKHDAKIKYYRLRPASADTCISCRHSEMCSIKFFQVRFSDLFLLKLLVQE